MERWILLQNAVSQERRVTSHICVDIGYVVVLHEHLSERHFLVVIGHIRMDFCGPFCGGYLPMASCFRFAAMLEERALKVAMRDPMVRGQSDSNLRLLQISTDGLPLI